VENVYLYSWHDAIAFALFAVSWIGYSLATDGHMIKRQSLNVLMNKERVNWMKVMTTRELRVIDTSIIAGLQQGTAFFASTSVFAIGGCFALMNASDQVINIASHLPVMIPSSRAMFEAKDRDPFIDLLLCLLQIFVVIPAAKLLLDPARRRAVHRRRRAAVARRRCCR
jgi:uncharacterized membrane protein